MSEPFGVLRSGTESVLKIYGQEGVGKHLETQQGEGCKGLRPETQANVHKGRPGLPCKGRAHSHHPMCH